jgi:predicted Zn-dependent protease
MRMQGPLLPKKLLFGAALIFLTALAVSMVAAELNFRPGFNLFNVDQDVQVGKENATQVDKQLPILNDAIATGYINDLGKRLSTFAPDNQPQYVWQFKVVNSRDINAFALPGGYIYVNRATIESADDEAELAGVIAHEEGHVVLRHGTHQASESMLVKAPLAILGGFFGQSGSLMGTLAQYGIGFGVQSIMLHNSRSMESQADSVGTYVLYQAGYDPHAMAQFFQIIEEKYPQRTIQFLSDHPNPGNRIKAVDEEIPELGPPKKWVTDNPRFHAVKNHVLSLAPAPQPKPQQ